MLQYQIEERHKGYFAYTCKTPNKLGEQLSFFIHKTDFDWKYPKSNANIWYKEGHITKDMKDWWFIDTEVETPKGCYAKYNPQHCCKQVKDYAGNIIANYNSQIDFDWVLPATEENLKKIVAEIEARFLGQKPSGVCKLDVVLPKNANYLNQMKALKYIDSADLKYYIIECWNTLNNGRWVQIEADKTPLKALEDVLKQQGHLVNTQFQGMKMNTVKKYDGKAEMLHSKEPVKYTVTLLDKQTGKATNYKSYYTFTNF